MDYTRALNFKSLSTIATASQTTNHTSVWVGDLKSAVVFLEITTITGTTHTLDVKFQGKSPGGTWRDMPAAGVTAPYKFSYPQASATTAKCAQLAGPFPQYMRAVSSLGAASRGRWSILGYGLENRE